MLSFNDGIHWVTSSCMTTSQFSSIAAFEVLQFFNQYDKQVRFFCFRKNFRGLYTILSHTCSPAILKQIEFVKDRMSNAVVNTDALCSTKFLPLFCSLDLFNCSCAFLRIPWSYLKSYLLKYITKLYILGDPTLCSYFQKSCRIYKIFPVSSTTLSQLPDQKPLQISETEILAWKPSFLLGFSQHMLYLPGIRSISP